MHFTLGEKAVAVAAAMEMGLRALGWRSWSFSWGRGGKPRSGTTTWPGDPGSRTGLAADIGGVREKTKTRLHSLPFVWGPRRSPLCVVPDDPGEKGHNEGSLSVSARTSIPQLCSFSTTLNLRLAG